MGDFSIKDIAEKTDLSKRQAIWITEIGAIKPDRDPGVGRGKVRRYSKVNLVDFFIAKELNSCGLNWQQIKKILSESREIIKNKGFTRNYGVEDAKSYGVKGVNNWDELERKLKYRNATFFLIMHKRIGSQEFSMGIRCIDALEIITTNETFPAILDLKSGEDDSVNIVVNYSEMLRRADLHYVDLLGLPESCRKPYFRQSPPRVIDG